MSVPPLSRHRFVAHAQRFLDIDLDDARDALLLHRDADQLARHLHGDLVVRDEEELRLRRHALDHLAEALGVAVVERRIDLVEHAERRRIELEHREHQGDRGQRLLAAGKQVDGAVLLAGRLRHDLDAGVEDLFAGQDQPGLAAAEELREEDAELAVHVVVGILQLLARLAVDAADGVFQRVDGLGQVLGLAVEEALAFARGVQFVEGGEVHRAERLDLGAEARDVAGQQRLLHLACQFRRQFLLVGVGLGETGRILLLVQLGSLLLQAQVADAVAQRVQALLGLQARFLELAQLGGGAFQRIAVARQRALAALARRQGLLQLLLGRALADGFALLAACRRLAGDALDLLPRDFARAADLLQFSGTLALGKARLLQFARKRLFDGALFAQGGIALVAFLDCRLQPGAQFQHDGSQSRHLAVGQLATAALGFLAGVDFIQVGIDLRNTGPRSAAPPRPA
jgi:hypothetical protein